MIGTDEIILNFKLDDYMMFFFDIKKKRIVCDITKEKIKEYINGFDNIKDINMIKNILLGEIIYINANCNINIYDNIKSFDIFQNLLTNKISQTELLNKIFILMKNNGNNSAHNMMDILMEHFYEYARSIVLNHDNDSNEHKLIHLKAKYIGYILILLILRYYSRLFKIYTYKNMKLYIKSNTNTKYAPHTIRDNTTRQIYHDIMNKFIEAFPIFINPLNEYLRILIGTN